MRYVRWATMWHICVDEDLDWTLCNRQIPPAGYKVTTDEPGRSWLCAGCAQRATA